jgi:YD repeat-containing protein
MTARHVPRMTLAFVALASCSEPRSSPPPPEAAPPAPAVFAGPCAEIHTAAPPPRTRRVDHLYDRAGRRIATVVDEGADGAPETLDVFVFDRQGRETARIRVGPGTSERTAYDAAGRPASRVIEEGGRRVSRTEFHYDDTGRLASATSDLESTSFEHDDRGNLRSERSTADDGRLRGEIQHDYDGAGHRTETRFVEPVPGSPQPTVRRVRYLRDSHGDLVDQITEIDWAPAGHTTHTHDGAGHRTLTSVFDASGTLVETTRTRYDAAGNPLAETAEHLRLGSTSETSYDYACWHR